MPRVDDTILGAEGTGVVVLGHGSRAPEALTTLNWIAGRLAERLELPVLAASLQFNSPTLDDCCKQMAEAGAKRVIIAPYFLFSGNHLLKDIPHELDRLRRELADVEFILADPLGADDLMVEVLARRTLSGVAASGRDEEAHGLAAAPADTAHGSATGVFTALLNGCCSSKSPLPQHPIEAESFEIIDSLLEPEDPEDPEYKIVRRIVHTTGDPSLARAVIFSAGAAGTGVSALAGKSQIYCDVNMVAAGVKPTATTRGLGVTCLVADPAAAELARKEGLTRGAAAMRLASGNHGSRLDGAVVAIGNSPTALFELLRLAMDTGVKPALVIGVPVGFVGAAESKEALATSGLPHITLPGNRGGSNVAAAIINALIRLSAEQK